MSEDIRTEDERRIAELEALTTGQAAHIAWQAKKLDECERSHAATVLALEKVTRRMKGAK